jgi:hypothetical protein
MEGYRSHTARHVTRYIDERMDSLKLQGRNMARKARNHTHHLPRPQTGSTRPGRAALREAIMLTQPSPCPHQQSASGSCSLGSKGGSEMEGRGRRRGRGGGGGKYQDSESSLRRHCCALWWSGGGSSSRRRGWGGRGACLEVHFWVVALRHHPV